MFFFCICLHKRPRNNELVNAVYQFSLQQCFYFEFYFSVKRNANQCDIKIQAHEIKNFIKFEHSIPPITYKMNRSKEKKVHQPNPIKKASVLSKMTFWWVYFANFHFIMHVKMYLCRFQLMGIHLHMQVVEATLHNRVESCHWGRWHLCGNKWYAKWTKYWCLCRTMGFRAEETETKHYACDI